MKHIDINLSSARLESFSVDLNADVPEITATIGLLTPGLNKIATFCVSTKAYYSDDTRFDMPLQLIEPIKYIGNELERILAAMVMRTCKQLTAPVRKKGKKKC